MSAPRSSEAVARSYLSSLQSATACIVGQHLDVPFGTFTIGDDQTVTFFRPSSLRAPAGGPSGLLFDVKHVFAIVEDRATVRSLHVETRMYQYRLLDRDHRELLVYHWQPGPRFAGPDHPHLHVSAALEAQVDALSQRQLPLDKRHLVTGRVSLPAVVRMLITDFDVVPLRHGWRDTLERAETAVPAAEASPRIGRGRWYRCPGTNVRRQS